MRHTDSPNELEKQLTDLRARGLAFAGQISAPGVRTERLLSFRPALQAAVRSASNAVVCSMLYSDRAFGAQLGAAKANLEQLLVDNELAIEARVTPRPGETAAVRQPRFNLPRPLTADAPTSGRSAVLEAGTVVPLARVRWTRAVDRAGFCHAEYNLWFKHNLCFASGFAQWPTDEQWHTARSYAELDTRLAAVLVEDGLQ